jgi:hypothetical protein
VLAACAGFVATARETEPAPKLAAMAAPPKVDLSSVQPLVVATPNLTTSEGMALFLRNYQAKFGDLQVDELQLFPDFGSMKRALPGQPNRLANFDYRGGFQQSRETETRKVDVPMVDLAGLNVEAVGRALADAAATARVPNGAVSHISFAVSGSSFYREYGIALGQPVIEIYVTNSFKESGRLMLNLAGEVRRVWAFEG